MSPHLPALFLAGRAACSAATFPCDPVNGTINSPGGEDRPRPAIEAVISMGDLPFGTPAASTVVKPGTPASTRSGGALPRTIHPRRQNQKQP